MSRRVGQKFRRVGPQFRRLVLVVIAVDLAIAISSAVGVAADTPATEVPIRIGSKKFTESVILGEIAAARLRDGGFRAEHVRELGGTRILWSALLRGDIDVYPEYTGTLREEILAGERLESTAGSDSTALAARLAGLGVHAGGPLGFNNTYALGMRRSLADSLGLTRISDLAGRNDLDYGLSHEFLDREDGWPGLKTAYGLHGGRVIGLDHELAYRALVAGEVEVTDLYSTDAEIRRYDLKILEDDRHWFPEYQAVWVWRADLASRVPGAVAALTRLEGAIDAAAMIAMNAAVRIDREAETVVAARFLEGEGAVISAAPARSHATPGLKAENGPGQRIFQRTREHLGLVLVSLLAAIVTAVPLGILAARHRPVGRLVLGVTGTLQTIPSLALLVFMLPWLGIGVRPALVALYLYSLFPIVRGTMTGLADIPAPLRESAEALGLPNFFRLRHIELPLAARSILSGIKTSAVINVGTATLGALVGAGGYGQPILTGIRLDDMRLILEGAVPAALLALLMQLFFESLDRFFVSEGLGGAGKS